VHNVEFNLDPLRFLSIPISHTAPFFPIRKADEDFALNWIEAHGIRDRMLVGMNAGGGRQTEKWVLDRFAALGDLVSEKLNASIILFWGPGEEEDAKMIASKMKTSWFMIPQTKLKQLGALLKQCSYLISNDTGPMHIAASLGVSTLGIFGPVNPHLQGPYGKQHMWVRNEQLDCLECNLTKCPIGNICMTDLSVDTVYSAFQELIQKNKK
jgi:ADP-heptose:LPS heptosyltransferase